MASTTLFAFVLFDSQDKPTLAVLNRTRDPYEYDGALTLRDYFGGVAGLPSDLPCVVVDPGRTWQSRSFERWRAHLRDEANIRARGGR